MRGAHGATVSKRWRKFSRSKNAWTRLDFRPFPAVTDTDVARLIERNSRSLTEINLSDCLLITGAISFGFSALTTFSNTADTSLLFSIVFVFMCR
jgi:hypothetical protein